MYTQYDLLYEYKNKQKTFQDKSTNVSSLKELKAEEN